MRYVNLFLDDERVPAMSHHDKTGLGNDYSDVKNWVIVRDYFNFTELIANYFDIIKLISFDHDLACFKNGREYTGKDAINYLIDYCIDNDKKFPDFYIHTSNVRYQDMMGTIINYLSAIENVNVSGYREYHRGYVNGKFI